MKNIHKLFHHLPDMGWGDEREWKGTLEDFAELHSVLTGEATMALAMLRTKELQNEKAGLPAKTLRTIIAECKEEDTYLGHMLKKYSRRGGEFVLNIDLTEADELAGVLLKYRNL